MYIKIVRLRFLICEFTKRRRPTAATRMNLGRGLARERGGEITACVIMLDYDIFKIFLLAKGVER